MDVRPDAPAPAIFHVHPSLRCNLSCGHCYSSSSPKGGGLEPALVAAAIADAAALGCNVLSVSGGEPLMVPELPAMLAAGKACGMHVQIATNGWFLGSPALAAAAPFLDLVAVSIDGPPELHNAMRGSPRAFARLEAGLLALRALADGRLHWGFIHTVTAPGWEHLAWVARFAADAGAGLLQLHPLERAGRAEDDALGLALDDDGMAKTYIVSALLRAEYAGRMHVHTDVLHREHLPEPCDSVSALALIGTLVLEADGWVVPYAYGYDRRFAVCNVNHESLAAAWPRYVVQVVPALRAQVRALYDALSAPDAPELFSWHERMVVQSAVAPPPGAMPPPPQSAPSRAALR